MRTYEILRLWPLLLIVWGIAGLSQIAFFWEKGEKAGKRDSSANSLSAALSKEIIYGLLCIAESAKSIVVFEL